MTPASGLKESVIKGTFDFSIPLQQFLFLQNCTFFHHILPPFSGMMIGGIVAGMKLDKSFNPLDLTLPRERVR